MAYSRVIRSLMNDYMGGTAIMVLSSIYTW